MSAGSVAVGLTFVAVLVASAVGALIGHWLARRADRRDAARDVQAWGRHVDRVLSGRYDYRKSPPTPRPTAAPLAPECPVCGSGDPTAYVRCCRPDCPDGRY